MRPVLTATPATLHESILDDLAFFDDQDDVFGVAYRLNILQGVGAGDDHIAQFAGFQGADLVLPAQTFGSDFSGGLNGFHR